MAETNHAQGRPRGPLDEVAGAGRENVCAATAVAAATSTASALGLRVDDAVVLNDSNKLTVRLLPCDVVARIAPVAHHNAHLETELAQRLTARGAPVAALDPRLEPRPYQRNSFVITFWTYYEPADSAGIPEPAYARALAQLHASMRGVEVRAPRFTDRVDQALRLVACHEDTPALGDEDRNLLTTTLRDLGGVVSGSSDCGQLLHGEPHPGNLLATPDGLRFIDFETCCRGPVEFDLAHTPAGVGERYPGVDAELLRHCRTLVLAMITAWRWDRRDQLPDGRRLGAEWLRQLKSALG